MNIRGTFFISAVSVIAGTAVFALISHAFFPDDLRKLHGESQEQRDIRREQFKEDILEKRKEVLTKWASRKDQWEEKLNKERERVMSGFELRRTRKVADGSSFTATTTRIQEVGQGGFLFTIRKTATGIMHFFHR